MTLHQLHDCLTAFLARIEPLTDTDLHDAFVNEIIRTGGTYMDPPKGDNATSHLFQVSLHNVAGHGTKPSEAFADWKDAATSMAEHMLDEDLPTNAEQYT